MELVREEEGVNRGLISRVISAIYLAMYVICCLSFNVSIVTPLNGSEVYSERSKIRGLPGNVVAE